MARKQSGHIVARGSILWEVDGIPTLLRSGDEIPASMPAKIVAEHVASGFAEAIDGDRAPRAARGQRTRSPKGKWDFDPATLSYKTIDELNIMVFERDDTVEPFDTVEEAIYHLSQNFGE